MALCDFALKILLLLSVFNALATASTKPNIIVILADDLGWNDVSFHGSSQIPTPNIDALAYNGVILNNHYVQALCTPSRASLLTGKYPIHTGMQHLVILEPEPWGLPLNEKLLPEYLHDAGYATHAIGKWHLGFFSKEYTPTHRGFDSHFGYWNGLQDYYDHTVHATFGPYKGYDMRRNMTVDYSGKGRYSTDLFTEEAVKLIREHNTDRPMFMYLAHLAPHTGNQDNPLQAPDEEVVKFAHIEDPERRVYAAMVSMLDKSIGSVMSALREKHMLENSIVVFLSDNGAQTFGIHANHGSNYPLRGLKGSPWEGGIRGVAAVWSPLLNNTQRVSNQLMHITDWLPTLYAAAGMNVTDLGSIDGVNMWPALISNQTSPRTEVVVNIDDIGNYASLRRGDWKYVIGSVVKGTQDQWYGEAGERDDYDVDQVLSSKTAIALAGVLTDKQLQEKRAIDHLPGNNFSVHLLTSEKVQEMRQNSIIQCEKPNTDEMSSKTACRPLESPCLFNIREDPCETINLASTRPLVLLSLEESLIQHRKTVVKPRNRPEDPNADPAKWNGIWTTWQDCPKHKKLTDSISPTALVVLIVLCIAFFVVIMVLLLLALKKFSSRTSPNGGAILSSIFKTFDFDAEGKQTTPDKDHRSPLAGHQQDEVFEQREITRQNSFRSAIRHMD